MAREPTERRSATTLELARAFALASVDANAEHAACDANGKRIEYKGYYLLFPDPTPTADRPAKYPYYRTAWYFKPKRQRRTRSTGERDAVQAWAALIDFADANPRVQLTAMVRVDPMDVLVKDSIQTVQHLVHALAEQAKNAEGWRTNRLERAHDLQLRIVLAFYYAMRKDDMANPDSIIYALRAAREVWGDEVTCRMLDGPAQHAFIAARRRVVDANGKRVNTDWTILAYLSTIWTGMHYAIQVGGILMQEAVHERISIKNWRPRAVLPKRRLHGDFGMPEMAKFLQAAHLRERWWVGSLIKLGVVPRPKAGHQLQPANVDLTTLTVDLLAVDEYGQWAVQNGVKNRAIVKIGATMAGWFTHWNRRLEQRPTQQARQYVQYLGRQMTSFSWVHSVARHAGVKIPKGFGAYLFRHFVARYLASHGCPTEQIAALLGHDIVEGATAYYVELEPWFLQRAAELIEQMLQELDEMLPEEMTLLVPHDIEDVPLRWVDPKLPMSEWQVEPDKLTFSWDSFRERAIVVPDRMPRVRGSCVAVVGVESQENKNLPVLVSSCERNPV
jgi:hypothetical protein